MQSIKEKYNKIKAIGDSLIGNNQFFSLFLVVLVAFSSFGLGRLSILEENQSSVTFENLALINTNIDTGIGESIGKYVASRSSKLYHAPWCSGAQRIKEENKIWFQTKEEAEASGRSPASNCKGI
ncbi:MAG: hypothetical protein KAJ58_01915 [Candidatus Pacebacteria bacterium]|nr:hypothetical protein [Candidatus Paceibacterota bacterium]